MMFWIFETKGLTY